MSEESIRSQPEEIYRLLESPKTSDSKTVRQELMRILGLVPAENNHAVPWTDVSRAIIDKTGVEVVATRESDELFEHVSEIESKHPWIHKVFSMYPKRPGCDDDWTLFARSHVFEDYSGILGISISEGIILHEAIEKGIKEDSFASVIPIQSIPPRLRAA